MGTQPKDLDIEVHNMSADTLIKVLAEFGKVSTVGSSFGVIKLWTADQDFDFSLPRKENKIGSGHKGFIVEVDSTLTIAEAAARRDFTFNSLAQNLITGELIDLFEGKKHIEAGIIKHTSQAFSEDPLRVLRGFQFAGRFNFSVHPETAKLCEELAAEFDSLSLERIWGKWEKWAMKSIKPSAGLRFLKEVGWLGLFPQISALVNTPQDREWHPEGNAFNHTCQVVDAATEIAKRDNIIGDEKLVLMFGALCHDFGKVATTQFIDGRWRSPGHANAGEEPTRKFLASIGAPIWLIERVVEVVKEHMVHVNFNDSSKTVKRFVARLKSATVADVLRVIEADHSGRGDLPKGMPIEAQIMADMAAAMGNEIKPIMLGRHLIAMGRKPGIEFGIVLKAAFEAQLDEVFDNAEDGIKWVKENF